MINRRTFASLLFATFLLATAAPRAWAEFRVCNSTGQDLNVAYSVYYTRGDFRQYESRGWRILADKECKEIDRFGNRRVWLLGMGKDGTMWEGASTRTPGRTFCQKTRDGFFFDDGAIPDVHTSAVVCEREGGTLKEFREYFGQTDVYTINFEPGTVPPARKDDRSGQPTLPPSSKVPPIWETYPDEPSPKVSRPGPVPTFAPG